LPGRSAHAADAHDRLTATIQFRRHESQQRFEEPDVRLANGELASVNADRQTAGACGDVIADQRALAPLVEPAFRGER
jgi:hypothetical protein